MKNSTIERSTVAPLNDAMNWFEGRFQNSNVEKVLGMKITASCHGNKEWEIGISILRILFRIGRYCIGKKYECSLACYRKQGFTTFCSSVEGSELWFDRFDLAIDSISQRRPHFGNPPTLVISK